MGGIGGKGWSAEGDAPEKCATLGIIRGRGPQAKRSGRGRVATFSGATPSAELAFPSIPLFHPLRKLFLPHPVF